MFTKPKVMTVISTDVNKIGDAEGIMIIRAIITDRKIITAIKEMTCIDNCDFNYRIRASHHQ